MANKDKTSAGVDTLAQVSERVRNSSNILIALSKDPSIDELTAALSLALVMDKFGKHATAIFSGNTPNIISFLQPENTFETNTNSLQDFIIALDKEKADHIRYKIDGDFVKVFITPYKTTLNEKDLEFSHGDFNVDLVIALNVKSEGELDSALVEYGRIKHDASSINISPAAPGSFGDIEWGDPNASSVCEMIYRLTIDLQDPESPLIDENTATAMLTGVISATNRFSNERTTADTLSVASNLLSYGANQQLIAKNIPVDILTAQAAPEEPKQEEKEESKEEPEEKTSEEEEKKPEEKTEDEKPADPTNFEIAHQGKKDESKSEHKHDEADKPAITPDSDSAPKEEEKPEETKAPESKDASFETDRIVAEVQQKRADEKAKAEEEAKRKREEQAAREKAEAEKNQAAKDAIFAKVNAEHGAAKDGNVLPPKPPKEFVSKPEEPAAEPVAEPIAEPVVNTKAPDLAPIHEDINEPSAIPNALPTDGNVLPPPPAPFDAGMMPPAFPSNEAPKAAPVVQTAPVEPKVSEAPTGRIPTANEIAAEFQAKKAAAQKAEEHTPVMPAVTMPSQGDVARALNNAQSAATPVAAAPVVQAPAAPTLAPRPAAAPASPVAQPVANPATPAQAPAAAPAPAANPDPGAFRIPGM
jgi:hypothetical protein